MSLPRTRRGLATAASIVLLYGGVAASNHRRAVPPFQIQPTHEVSAKSMSGQPALSWPNAHANETYIALGLEMPIVGTVGSGPELIILGAESYLLFMQEGMTMNAYSHLNISDSLLSSSVDPLVSFSDPSGLFSESPFSSSSSKSPDLRLLAVLLYKSNTASQTSQQPRSSTTGLDPVMNDLFGDDDDDDDDDDDEDDDNDDDDDDDDDNNNNNNNNNSESHNTYTAFNWDTWAADMNANPALRMDFDVSDFAAKADLGTPVAAEVLIVKNEGEQTDSVDASASWDIVSTLWQTPTPTAAAAAGAASGVRTGAPGLGTMPAGGDAGVAAAPSGSGSGAGASAVGVPFMSTGPEESDGDSEGADAGSGSSGLSAGAGPPYKGGSPNGVYTGSPGESGPGLGASGATSAVGVESTDSPLASSGSAGEANDGSDDVCDDDGTDPTTGGISANGASPSATGAGAAGRQSLVSAPAASVNVNNGGTTPTGSAAAASITNGGLIASMLADGLDEGITIGLDFNGDYATTITANLKDRHAARRTIDANSGWTLTLKTDLVAPTSSLVKGTEMAVSTRTTENSPSSTLQTIPTWTGSPLASSDRSSATSSTIVSSAAGGEVPVPVSCILGLVCVAVFCLSFL